MAKTKPLPAEPKTAAPESVEVELIKPHIHRGVQLQPPAKIKVRPGQVDWLRSQGVIKGAH